MLSLSLTALIVPYFIPEQQHKEGPKLDPSNSLGCEQVGSIFRPLKNWWLYFRTPTLSNTTFLKAIAVPLDGIAPTSIELTHIKASLVLLNLVLKKHSRKATDRHILFAYLHAAEIDEDGRHYWISIVQKCSKQNKLDCRTVEDPFAGHGVNGNSDSLRNV